MREAGRKTERQMEEVVSEITDRESSSRRFPQDEHGHERHGRERGTAIEIEIENGGESEREETQGGGGAVAEREKSQ